MKKLLAILLSLLILFACAACSPKPVVFKAAYTYNDPDNRYEKPRLLFKEDGSFSFSDSNDGLRLRGTYEYNKETGQLTLTSTNGRYAILLNVESQEVLRLVSFTDSEGKVTLSIPDNAAFNIGDNTVPNETDAGTAAADPT